MISRSFILILFAVSAFAQLQCGTRMCPEGNGCCNDVVMGPTCYSTTGAKCASTGIMATDGSMTTRLCGAQDAACGTICYNPESYYCCNGQLLQNSQTCTSSTVAPTPATTSAPTEAPTEAPTSAPTEAPTEAPTSAPTEAPTEAPTSSPTSPANQNNCFSYGSVTGLYCAEGEVCCGSGTISPSCLPANGTKKCCTWFLSATQCDVDEVCGGGFGPGASSYAQCGAPGTQFCNYGTGSNTFCAMNQTCCGQYGSYATCCDEPQNDSSSPVVTDAPTSAPATTTPPVLNNCPGAANSAGVNCSETETCCGSGTMTPSCLPADGSKKCCTWYLSSTQCNPDEVCGGDLGYGASSYARCGPAGTTFCNKGDAQNAFCAEDSPLCCGNYGQLAFCCKSNCTCPTDGSFSCVC